MSPDVLYQGHGITYEWNNFFYAQNNVMTDIKKKFP